MLGGEVVEGEQRLLVLGQAANGFPVFRLVFGGEGVERLLRLLAALRHPDLVEVLLRVASPGLGQLVQHVRRLVDPAALPAGLGEDLVQRLPEAQRTIPDRQLRGDFEAAPTQVHQ